MKTICVSMIVRDEAPRITRLLDSVKDYVDSFAIVDTGSSDDTIDVISRWAQKNNKELYLEEHEWVNFSHNRNIALHLAQTKTDTDYIWALDADWEVEVLDPNFRENLTCDQYYFILDDGTYSYPNERFMKADLEWRWLYPIHEQLWSKEVESFGTIDGVLVHVKEIGGERTDHYARDREILEKELDNPHADLSHTLFYLGQTCLQLDDKESADGYYRGLLELGMPGGDYEEIHRERRNHAQRMLAQLAPNRQECLQWYSRAYQERPFRLEAAYGIALNLRLAGHSDKAYEFLSALLTNHNRDSPWNMPQPEGDILIGFMPWIYQWGIASEWITLLAESKRYKDALRIAKEGLHLIPDSDKPRFELFMNDLEKNIAKQNNPHTRKSKKRKKRKK